MARVNLSFTKKFTAALDSKMEAAMASLASHSACAGIRNNLDAATKARVNHHGSFTKNVPARRFITAATMDINDVNLASELRETIKEALGTPVKRQMVSETIKERDKYYSYERTVTRDVRGAAFGRSDTGEQRGPTRVLMKIAQKLAENEKKAIAERSYEHVDGYESDIVHNAPRTAKAKGFDWPLVDTGKMYSSIKGWVE